MTRLLRTCLMFSSCSGWDLCETSFAQHLKTPTKGPTAAGDLDRVICPMCGIATTALLRIKTRQNTASYDFNVVYCQQYNHGGFIDYDKVVQYAWEGLSQDK